LGDSDGRRRFGNHRGRRHGNAGISGIDLCAILTAAATAAATATTTTTTGFAIGSLTVVAGGGPGGRRRRYAVLLGSGVIARRARLSRFARRARFALLLFAGLTRLAIFVAVTGFAWLAWLAGAVSLLLVAFALRRAWFGLALVAVVASIAPAIAVTVAAATISAAVAVAITAAFAARRGSRFGFGYHGCFLLFAAGEEGKQTGKEATFVSCRLLRCRCGRRLGLDVRCGLVGRDALHGSFRL
jgi:hypothetical protein